MLVTESVNFREHRLFESILSRKINIYCVHSEVNERFNSMTASKLCQRMHWFVGIILCLVSMLVTLFPLIKSCAVSPGPGYHRQEGRCETYFICSDQLEAFRFTCPSGLVFDLARKICNWPRNVDCGHGYAPLSKEAQHAGAHGD